MIVSQDSKIAAARFMREMDALIELPGKSGFDGAYVSATADNREVILV